MFMCMSVCGKVCVSEGTGKARGVILLDFKLHAIIS